MKGIAYLNILKGKVVRRAGGLAFSSKFAEFFLPPALGKAFWAKKIALNEDISLGFNMEDTQLAGKHEPNRVMIQGKIIGLERRDMDNLVTAQVASEKMRLFTSNNIALHIGQIISIALNLGSVSIVQGVNLEYQ
jgi:hypothetical protein